MDIAVVFGDIIHVPADAIITLAPSGPERTWRGLTTIDNHIAVTAEAGDMYTNQLHARASVLSNLETIVATGSRKLHHGQFDNVIFVEDTFESHLRNVVLAGLNAADEAGMKDVTLPLMRMGFVTLLMSGDAPEKTDLEVLKELAAGVLMYQQSDNPRLQSITFVLREWEPWRTQQQNYANQLKEYLGL